MSFFANDKTKFPVIDILPAQKEIMEKSEYGGTMRLGAYAAILKEDTKVFELYNDTGRLKEDKKRSDILKEQLRRRFKRIPFNTMLNYKQKSIRFL